MVLSVRRVLRIWQEHSTATAFNAEGFSKHSPFCSALAATERENSPHLSLTLVLDLSLAATASIPACIVLPLSRLTFLGFFFFFGSFSVFCLTRSQTDSVQSEWMLLLQREAVVSCREGGCPAASTHSCPLPLLKNRQGTVRVDQLWMYLQKNNQSQSVSLSGSAKTFIKERENPNEFVRRYLENLGK